MITEGELRAAMYEVFDSRKESEINTYHPLLYAALVEFEVDTPVRVAMFLAQVAHESGELYYWSELWGPTDQQKKYDPSSGSQLSKDLGNTVEGDGSKYRGRGPIQITGKANYDTYGRILGYDLVTFPVNASKPEWGFRIAGAFWKKKGLNELADPNTVEAFKKVTKKINGGYNGLEERQRYWEIAKKSLAVEGVTG